MCGPGNLKLPSIPWYPVRLRNGFLACRRPYPLFPHYTQLIACCLLVRASCSDGPASGHKSHSSCSGSTSGCNSRLWASRAVLPNVAPTEPSHEAPVSAVLHTRFGGFRSPCLEAQSSHMLWSPVLLPRGSDLVAHHAGCPCIFGPGPKVFGHGLAGTYSRTKNSRVLTQIEDLDLCCLGTSQVKRSSGKEHGP